MQARRSVGYLKVKKIINRTKSFESRLKIEVFNDLLHINKAFSGGENIINVYKEKQHSSVFVSVEKKCIRHRINETPVW